MAGSDAMLRPAVDTTEEALQPVSYAVTLVGAGALGAELCIAFTQCLQGFIRRVTIIDPDVVQPHNLQASEAWARAASVCDGQVIGNLKADCVVQFCKTLAPHTEWVSKPCEFADVGWGELLDSDVIVTCTDSVVSRMEVAYAARMLRKPMLDAGVLGQGLAGGRVAFYAPQTEAACYSCGLSVSTRAAVLEHMCSPSLSCAALPSASAMGVSQEGATSAALIAKRVVQQLIEGLHAADSTAWRMLGNRTDAVTVTRSEECPWHHDAECLLLEDDSFICNGMTAEDVLLLPWPMALRVVCMTCGARHDTPMRLARLRRGERCRNCGESALQAGRVLERICRDDDVAQRTPAQLGLPPSSVLPVRRRIQTQRTHGTQ